MNEPNSRAVGGPLDGTVGQQALPSTTLVEILPTSIWVTIPVQEVDETGRFVCSFNVENGAFNFELTEKQ